MKTERAVDIVLDALADEGADVGYIRNDAVRFAKLVARVRRKIRRRWVPAFNPNDTLSGITVTEFSPDEEVVQ